MRSMSVTLLLFILPLAASGCAVPVEGGCDAKAAPAPVSGCLVPVGGWGDDGPMTGMQAVDRSLSGVVVDAGTGEPADECLTTGGPVGHHVGTSYAAGIAPEDVSWFELEDTSGDRYTVAITAGDDTPTFEPGDELDVRYSFMFGGFGPDSGNLEIRANDGTLIGWVGEAGSLDGLAMPDELERVSEGAVVCSERSTGCGDWRAYDLEVAAGGVDATVPYGATAQVGELALLHGGYEHEISSGAQGCPDWYVSHVALGLFPSP